MVPVEPELLPGTLAGGVAVDEPAAEPDEVLPVEPAGEPVPGEVFEVPEPVPGDVLDMPAPVPEEPELVVDPDEDEPVLSEVLGGVVLTDGLAPPVPVAEVSSRLPQAPRVNTAIKATAELSWSERDLRVKVVMVFLEEKM